MLPCYFYDLEKNKEIENTKGIYHAWIGKGLS